MTRSRRSLAASFRVLALVATTAFAAAAPQAEAQTTRILVSNEGQDGNGARVVMATSFTTGANATGYTLSAVRLGAFSETFEDERSGTYVSVKEDDNGKPGDLVARLSNPAGDFEPSLYTEIRFASFPAPSDTTLEPDTTYWVVANEEQSSQFDYIGWAHTPSDAEDSGGLSDWSVGNTKLIKNGSNWSGSETSALRLSVRGYANSILPKLTVAAASADEGAAVQFTVTLSTTASDDVTVQYDTSISGSDTASASDFTAASSQTLTIAAGQTTGTVSIATTDDSDAESDETFTLTLSNPSSNAVLGAVATATGTINASDQTPELSISAASAVEGGTVNFTVTLTPASTEEVTVDYDTSLVSGDTATASDFTAASSQTLTIAANATSGTIGIATTQDTDDESPETFTLTLSNASANAALGTSAAAKGTIYDEDSSAITLSKNSLEVDEGDSGGSTYTVKLATQPSETVTVTIGAGANSGLTISPDTLTFTQSDWSQARTVTVVKAFGDGDTGSATLTHSANVGNYAGVSASLPVTISEPSTPGIVVSLQRLHIKESADNQSNANVSSYAVRLQTQPSSDVTVEIRRRGTGFNRLRLAAAPARPGSTDLTLTFTSDDWDQPQSVNVRANNESGDNANQEHETGAMLTHNASGGGYGSASEVSLPVIIEDKDVGAGYVFSRTSFSLDEGETESYTVRLDTRPSAGVSLAITGGGSGLTVSPNPLVFTRDNWIDPRTVSVSAASQVASASLTLAHTGTGGGYGSVTAGNVSVTVTGSDLPPELDISAASAVEGETVNFTVTLTPASAAEVTVDYDTSLVSGDTATASDFTAASSQTLTIAANTSSGVIGIATTQDTADESPETFTVTLSNASANAALGTTTTAKGTIYDEDSSAITLSKNSLDVDESDSGGSTYTARLATQPSETVTVTISAGENSGLTISPDTLTFTQTDWSQARTVTVTADGNGDTGSATLTHSANVGNYAGVSADLPVTIETISEPSTPGIVVSLQRLHLREATNNQSNASTSSYSVQLQTQPSGDVTVEIRRGGTGFNRLRLAAAPDRPNSTDLDLTFTSDNWDQPQSVNVRANNETAGGANQEHETGAMLTHSASGGGYDSVSEVSLPVIIEDKDVDAGYVFSRTSFSLGEGETESYTVRLDTRPTADVSLAITGGGSDLTVSPTPLIFTRDNWIDPQTVSVSTADELASASLTLAHTGTGGGYDSVAAGNVSVTVNGSRPGISSIIVTSTPLESGNTYKRDEVIEFAVNFGADVQVDTTGGDPTLTVDFAPPNPSVAKAFAYTGMSGSRTLNFEYTVQSGDEDTDGIALPANPLILNGATIQDSAGQHDAALSRPARSALTNHKVDGDEELAAALLSELKLLHGDSEITLTPVFAGATTSYTATVPTSITQLTLQTTAADGGSATISQDDASSEDSGYQVALSGAETELTITAVRPPRPNRAYTLTVKREDTETNVSIASSASTLAFYLDDIDFTVTRDSVSITPLDVRVDFSQSQTFLPAASLSRTVTIPANETSASFTLEPGDFNSSVGADGTLTASVTAGTGYVAAASGGSAAVTMVAADPAIVVSFDSSAYSFLEDGGTGTIQIVAETAAGVPRPTFDGRLGFLVYANADSATSADYSFGTVALNITASDFSQSGSRFVATEDLSLTLHDDSAVEGDESLNLTFSPSGSLLDGVGMANADGSLCAGDCRVTVTIVDDESPPAQVSGVTVTPGNQTLAVNWSAVTAADGYKVQWKSGSETFSDAATDSREATVSSGATTSHTITGLTNGTDYTVRVIATRSGAPSDGSPSTEVSGTAGLPSLTIADASAAEGSAVTFTVTLNRESANDVTVGYSASDGTATSDSTHADGADYTAPASGASLTIAANSTSGTISIDTGDDTVDEGDEDFTVTLSGATNATIETATATGTILNDDATPTLTIADASATEGSAVVFTVTLSPVADEDVTVQYSTSDGTATSDANHADGADYTAPAGNATLTIAEGDSSGTISIATGDDTVDEDDENFTLTLANPSPGAALGAPSTAIGAIEDNDTDAAEISTVAFTNLPPDSEYGLGEVIEVSVTYNEAVTVTGVPRVALEMSGTPGAEAYALYNASASTDTTLVFRRTVTAANDDDSDGIGIGADALELNGGTIVNKDTTVAANRDHGAVTGGPAVKTRWVESIDVTSSPEVSDPAGIYGAGEDVEFTLTFAQAVTVTGTPKLVFSASDGASQEAAFESGSGSTGLVFEWTVPADVPGTESEISVPGNPGAGGLLLTNAGLVLDGGTIRDSSSRDVNIRHGAKATGVEADTTRPVLASGAAGATVNGTVLTLNFERASGVADHLDEDSTPAVADFVVSEGGYSRPVSDVEVSGATVTLTLASAVGHAQAVTVGYVSGVNKLRDLWGNNTANLSPQPVRNDSPEPNLSIADVSVNEDAGTATFTVSLDVASGEETTVDYATSDDTAEAGSDYTAVSDTLTIAAGQAGGTFDVTVTDDSVNEGDETFTVALSNATNAAIAAAAATATIIDDEGTPTLTVADASATEGSAVVFTVTLSPVADEAVTVGYSTTDGTATSDTSHVDGADYTAPASGASLSISAGSASATISVATGDDAVDEEDETFTLTLSSPSENAELGTARAATGTIRDNDTDPAGISAIAFTNPPGDGEYGLGETIEVSVTYSEAVTVTGTPRVALEMSGTPSGEHYALYNSSASTDTRLVFRRTVTAANDDDADGIGIGADALELNGGSIVNKDTTVAASRAHAAVTGGPNVKTRSVASIAVTSSPHVSDPAGIYGAGEIVEFTLTFSQSVTVTGTPKLVFSASDGAAQEADYESGSGSTGLVFEWTVPSDVPGTESEIGVPSNVASGGTLLITAGLVLDGGTIKDSSSRDVNIRHAAQATGVEADTTGPVLASGAAGATVNGASLVLSFERASGVADHLDEDSTPAAPDFAVSVAGSSRTVSSVEVDGAAVTLTLSAPAGHAETVTVSFTQGTNKLQDLWGSEAANISNRAVRNDSPEPKLSIADVTVNEDAGKATFTVSLDVVSGEQATVEYATSDGTAEAGSDYSAAADTLTIAAGSSSGSFDVTVSDDTVSEGDETFTVTLSNATNATIGTATATGTITDNEALPSLTVTDAAAMEGSAVVFTVTLGQVADDDVTVQYSTTDGTATSDTSHVDGADYTAPAAAATLTISAGDTTGTVSIATGDDRYYEVDETFTLALSSPSSNARLGSDSTATGTIRNNDTASSDATLSGLPLSVGGSAVSLSETFDSATYSYTADIANTAATVSVSAVTNQRGAKVVIENDDDAASPKTADLAMAFGENTVNVTVTAEDGSEQVYTVKITRAFPQLGWDREFYYIDEDAGEVEMTVTLTPRSSSQVTVYYATQTTENSTVDQDYTATDGTLTFEVGDTEKTLTVTILDDNIYEPDNPGSVPVLLSNLTGTAVLDASRSEAVLYYSTIDGTPEDNDLPPTASMSDVTVAEDAGTMQFTLSLSHAVDQDIVYRTGDSDVGGTASFPSDYTRINTGGVSTLTIPALQTSATFDVTIIDDDVDEDDETITMDWGRLGSHTATASLSVTGTITDDDTRGVTLSRTTLSVAEGDSQPYTVVLDSEPTASVTVTPSLKSGSSSDVTFSPETLGFTTDNWYTAQTVTVSASPDDDDVNDTATIAHNVAGGDYGDNNVTASDVAVTVAGLLELNVGAIADDDRINIAEKAAGFTISGDTGGVGGVLVTVTVGSTELTATSAEADPATWSVSVPGSATYITGTSVDVTVSASKTGYTAPADVERALAVDLTAPTAPGYTAPDSLKVGEAIADMDPSGGAGIGSYSAAGLPSGLVIDGATGVIGGTPDTADANTADATVTASDPAGNTDTVDITFPAVAKGDQTLDGFEYSVASLTYGSPAPTLTAPTGAQTTLGYSASPAEVCTVNASTGELTIAGAGDCVITVTAESSDDYNVATVTFTVTVQATGNLVLVLEAIADDNTVNIAEHEAGFSIGGNTGTEAGVTVTVTIGTTTLSDTSADNGGTAEWSVDVPANATYITGTSVDVTVSASKTGYTAPADVERALAVDLTAPTAPGYTAPDSLKVGEAIADMDPSGGAGIGSYSAAGLPSGLVIDGATGVIGGTPDTASATTATATVTASDPAGNTDTVDIAFPAVAKGDQTLEGFEYSVASLTYGSPAPTLTAPTGAQTTLGFAASPAEVCSVNASTGELTIAGAGDCVITVTAESSDDYNSADAIFTVTVQATGNLVLVLDDIADDNTVNIAEHEAGFSISGNTETESGVTVSVTIGTTTLTDTSADNGGTAEWSVDVPEDAAYITGTSVDVTVSASKTGYTAPADVERALTVDLTAPTAPGYTAPDSLKVGEAIADMDPSGGAGIGSYSAAGLPSGLVIDGATGVIGGTPDTASASTATATVTASDTAGNTDTVDIAFPAVARGDQTLEGFEYSVASLTYGSPAPTLTAPTGAQTTLGYAASPAEVCTVNASTGELTIAGAGDCVITVTAESSDDYNSADAIFTVTVQATGNLVLVLDDIADDNTVNIAEHEAGFSISGNTETEAGVTVSVTIGTTTLTDTSADNGGTAEWSVDVPGSATYITGTSVDVTVSASKTGYTAPADVERTLTIDLTAPTAPGYTAPDSLKVGEAIADMDPSGGVGIGSYSAAGLPSGLVIDGATGVIGGTPDTADANTADATVTASDPAGNTDTVDITFPAVDDVTRAVLIEPTALDVPEGGTASYTVVLSSQPTATVTVVLSVTGSSDVSVNPTSLTFAAGDWDDPQTVEVRAQHDPFTGNDTATVSHAVSGGDYQSVTPDNVAVTVIDDETDSTAIALSLDTASVDEDAGATTVTVTATLNAAPRIAATGVNVTVGASGDSATEGEDYTAVPAFTLTIEAGAASASETFVLTPTADALDESDEQISVSGTTPVNGLSVTGATIAIGGFVNTAPAFAEDLSGMLEVTENTAAETPIGTPVAATDGDGHGLDYALGGADAASFSIDAQSGQLLTLAPLDHETRARYSVRVTADDGRGGTAAFAVSVEVTDVDEQPGTPGAPTVLATSGRTTSLSLRWRAPDTNAGPAITGYELQYRAGSAGEWRSHRHTGKGTRATIARLTASTQYQARVRALNGETPGEWSEPGSGRTGRADNTPPEFADDLPTALEIAENTGADTDLGTPFTATDADEDTLTYLLEGTDRAAFEIDETTGQISTRAALDRESKASYALTVRADDGSGGADRLALAVSVTDVDEQAGTAAAPTVLASRGSATRLEVNWRTPETNGGPAIRGYEVQYRTVNEGDGADGPDEADEADEAEAPWADHRHLGTGTRTVVAHLDPGTAYEARVRALNGEIAGEWSEPGAGSTGAAANSPPVFDEALAVELGVEENATEGIDIGEPFTAADTDDDTLTYLLEGTAGDTFSIDPQSGQLRTRAVLDHEASSSHVLRIRADDGRGGADLIGVTVHVLDVDEQAAALSAPGVLAAADSTTSLDLRWSAPEPNRGPAVTAYEVQYGEVSDGEWIDHAHEGGGTRATIADLTADTAYQARIRALNGELPGDWSEPGTGRTGRSDNTAPVFDDGLTATLTVVENTGADTDIGTPFTATDTDADTLTYLLEGADSGAFAIDADTGQLTTRAPLDHEARASYSLSVRVSDGAGGADTLAVTVDVADLDEAPAQPGPPLVLATADSTMSIDLRWRAPDADGGPPVNGYEVQYRKGTDSGWMDVGHEGTDTRATIDALEVAVDYQARVRALNEEGSGAWSEPGTGRTGSEGNTAPAFADETATRSVPENRPAGEPVGTPVTAVDTDRDSLTYTLEGADAVLFDVDPQTGQILTRSALDHEAGASHAVTVTAWDGKGGADTVAVSIEVIDAQEEQSLLGPEAPTGVTLARRLSLDASNVLQGELTLRWNAPEPEASPGASPDESSAQQQDEGSQDSPTEDTWFEFRLGRYPESDNGMTAPAFQCAANRAFESDGWRRIPDSGAGGANARSWAFDAQALGCYVLADTFELRAQVRAVTAGEDGAAARTSAPSTEARMRDEAPGVVGLWLDSADVDALGAGDDLAFTVAFTEPVRVAAAEGSPTLAIRIGEETRQAVFAVATQPPVFRNYGSGAIGSRLEFRYEVRDGDDLTAGIVVPENAIAVADGAGIVDATGPAGHAAILKNGATTLTEGTTVLAATPKDSLAASFEADSVPETHDGETPFSVQISFGEPDGDGTGEDGEQTTEPSDAFEGLLLSESSFLVTGGGITEVSRLTDGDNRSWTVAVEPESRADVSISLGPTLDCADAGAVCTGDGRRLSNNIHAVVKGPPGLSVADARVKEGPDATMDFAVTLSRALEEAVSVDYATADGTATAGEDYTETFGTLTFEPGEVARTVSVEVLDDAHDDDGETFTVTLSDPSGANAYLINDTATGTIHNSDPMPKAWIARFGRTVSDHVVDAIQGRLRDRNGQAQASHFTLGGLRVDGFFPSLDDGIAQPYPGAAGAGAAHGQWGGSSAIGTAAYSGNGSALGSSAYSGNGSALGSSAYPDRGFAGGIQPEAGAAGTGRGLPSLKDILMGSSFYYTSADEEQDADAGTADARHQADEQHPGGFTDWSAWGRTASTQFRGADGPLSLQGGVDTGMIGVDALRDRWLVGAVLAHSEGEGGFTHETASGGAIASTLTSLHPFAQYRFNERTSVWGTLGYGLGDLSLTPDGADASVDTDLRMTMAALGGRGVLSVRTGKAGSFEMAVRSDAMFTETVSGTSENLLAATGATSRVRLVLEGTGSLPLSVGGVLKPTLEAGLRYDGGDAETGAGLEIGGGLDYSAGRLTAQVNARVLAAHEDQAYEEWGFSGSIAWRAAADGRGLTVDLGSIRGAAQSGLQSLWSRPTASGLAPVTAMDAAQRYRAEFGYGFAGRKGRALWVPFLGAESSANGSQSLRMGVRLTSGANAEAGLEIDRLDTLRGEPGYGFNLAGRVRW